MQRTVEIHVEGGRVTVVRHPPDVAVTVRDYDVPETDSEGNQVSDCSVEVYEAEAAPTGPFCPEDGEPMKQVAEVGGGTLTFYACPSCDGWTYNAEHGEYISGIPSWADELQKAVAEVEKEEDRQGNLPESLGDDGSIALYS